MGAPAASAPRTAPRPKTVPGPRTRATPRPARNQRPRAGGNVVRMPVNAVGRTAATVGGIADSGIVVGMARSRLWIGVLGVLLGGIVALNVVGLSISSSESRVASRIDDLVRANSVQQSRLAHRLSNGEISRKASVLGLAVPAPDAVRYLDSRGSDATRAAKRLAAGEIANAPPALAVTDEATTDTTTTDLAAAATTAVDPASTTTATTVDPAAGVTATDPTLAPVP
jgi:hypothetical protein